MAEVLIYDDPAFIAIRLGQIRVRPEERTEETHPFVDIVYQHDLAAKGAARIAGQASRFEVGIADNGVVGVHIHLQSLKLLRELVAWSESLFESPETAADAPVIVQLMAQLSTDAVREFRALFVQQNHFLLRIACKSQTEEFLVIWETTVKTLNDLLPISHPNFG